MAVGRERARVHRPFESPPVAGHRRGKLAAHRVVPRSWGVLLSDDFRSGDVARGDLLRATSVAACSVPARATCVCVDTDVHRHRDDRPFDAAEVRTRPDRSVDPRRPVICAPSGRRGDWRRPAAGARRALVFAVLAFASTSCTHGPVREFAYGRSQKSALSRREAPSPRVLSPLTWTGAALSDVAITTVDTVFWVGAGPVLALGAPFSDPRTLVLLPLLIVASPLAMLMAYEMSEPRDSDPSVSPAENAPETTPPEAPPDGAAPSSHL